MSSCSLGPCVMLPGAVLRLLRVRASGQGAHKVELSREDVEKILAYFSVQQDQAKEFSGVLDLHGQDKVDMRDLFLSLACSTSLEGEEDFANLHNKAYLEYVFNIYDVQGDGVLDMDELQAMARHISGGKEDSSEGVSITEELARRMKNGQEGEFVQLSDFVSFVQENSEECRSLLRLPVHLEEGLAGKQEFVQAVRRFLLDKGLVDSPWETKYDDGATVILQDTAGFSGSSNMTMLGIPELQNVKERGSHSSVHLTPLQEKCQWVLQNTICSTDSKWNPASMAVTSVFDGVDTILEIIDAVQEVFASQDIVLEPSCPCKVFGDLHGQMAHLYGFFKTFGVPDRFVGDIEYMEYVFIGDFVDRGPNSIEVVMTLFCLKLLYPDAIHLLRGNHEDVKVNANYGFLDECHRVFGAESGQQLFKAFNRCFEYMPLAAVIENQIFCVHGGIGKELRSLSDLRSLQRPLQVKTGESNISREEQIVIDALWSDPTAHDLIEGIHPNKNRSSKAGTSICVYGPDQVTRFLENNNLQLIVRAHEVPDAGVDLFCQGKLITLTSVRNYHRRPQNPTASNPSAMLLLWRGDKRGNFGSSKIKVDFRFVRDQDLFQSSLGEIFTNVRDLTPARCGHTNVPNEKSDMRFVKVSKLDVEKAHELFRKYLCPNDPGMSKESFVGFMDKFGISANYSQNYFRAFQGRSSMGSHFLNFVQFCCGLCSMIPEVKESVQIGSIPWKRRMSFIFDTYDLQMVRNLSINELTHLVRHSLRAASDTGVIPDAANTIRRWCIKLLNGSSYNVIDLEGFVQKMRDPNTRLPGIDLIARFPKNVLAELIMEDRRSSPSREEFGEASGS